MATFVVRGTDRHLKREIAERVASYFADQGLELPEALKPGLILYGLATTAEMLRAPSGLFTTAEVECPVEGVLGLPAAEREPLRRDIIRHLKESRFARPALVLAHCKIAGDVLLHGTFQHKNVPLCFLGPRTLVEVSAGALRELRKTDPKDRLKVFRGSDPTQGEAMWRRVHERHLRLLTESTTHTPRRALRPASVTV